MITNQINLTDSD